MMDFSRAPITFLLPLPIMILMLIGLGTVFVGLGYVVVQIVRHLAWI